MACSFCCQIFFFHSFNYPHSQTQESVITTNMPLIVMFLPASQNIPDYKLTRLPRKF